MFFAAQPYGHLVTNEGRGASHENSDALSTLTTCAQTQIRIAAYLDQTVRLI